MANELERLVDKLRAEGLRTRERGHSNYAAIFTSIANEIAAALQQAQQPGAQAVGFISRVELQSLDAARGDGENFNATVFARPTGQAGVTLYTDPPALPEGVSEEDVEDVRQAAVIVGPNGDRERGERLYDLADRLESYRARLRATDVR